MMDPRLAHQAKRLRDTALFRGTTDLCPLFEKQLIFLALAGIKPVSEAATGHWVATFEGRETRPDDPREVARFLDSLGLAHRLTVTDHKTVAVVSLEAEQVARYDYVRTPAGAGELFGYPATAIEAVVTDQSMSPDEQAAVEQAAGLPASFSPFIFSRGHWQDEIPVATSWYELLRTYGLTEDPASVIAPDPAEAA